MASGLGEPDDADSADAWARWPVLRWYLKYLEVACCKYQADTGKSGFSADFVQKTRGRGLRIERIKRIFLVELDLQKINNVNSPRENPFQSAQSAKSASPSTLRSIITDLKVSHMKPQTTRLILIAAAILIAVIWYCYRQPRFVAGEKAPDFQVTLIDGSSARLSDTKGKYTLLQFWGSRCGPCRSENPYLSPCTANTRNRVLKYSASPSSKISATGSAPSRKTD